MKLIHAPQNVDELVRKDFEEAWKTKSLTNLGRFTFTFDMSKLIPSNTPKAVIEFDPIAYMKMDALIQACDKEIAWHGVVTRTDNLFKITDILCYPQIVASTTVESDDDRYPDWRDKLSTAEYNALRFQGHSHVSMGVTPSGVDDAFYQKILQALDPNAYYIFTIGNKRREYAYFIYDLAANLIYETKDIEVKIGTVDVNAWAKEQLAAQLKTRVYTAPSVVTYPNTNTSYFDGRSNFNYRDYLEADKRTPDSLKKNLKDQEKEKEKPNPKPNENKMAAQLSAEEHLIYKQMVETYGVEDADLFYFGALYV